MHKKIVLLGSCELGRELVIALKRLGQTAIAAYSWQLNQKNGAFQ
jgi:formate-dependent phosphoribosylglycinamide formyltransferase (GAR transformylase)